jgi:hypothetical protein
MYAWNSVEKLDTCDTVEDEVDLACAAAYCDGCSILLSHVYKTYEYSLNDMYTEVFLSYEENMFNTLDAENQSVLATLEEQSS